MVYNFFHLGRAEAIVRNVLLKHLLTLFRVLDVDFTVQSKPLHRLG